MKLGKAKYRMMCQALDDAGMHFFIKRVANKRFELILNFEIIKTYRKRQSCNAHIQKKYKEYHEQKK